MYDVDLFEDQSGEFPGDVAPARPAYTPPSHETLLEWDRYDEHPMFEQEQEEQR